MNLRILCSFVAFACVLPVQATAQFINSGPASSSAGSVPQGEYNEQSLTTNRGDLSVYAGPLANPKFGTNEEAGVHAIRLPFASIGGGDGGEMAWFLQAGAAYGIVRGFEVGVFIPPLLVSPKTGSGDLPLFLTWATSVDDLDIGLRTTITAPVRSDSYWRLNPGIHGLLRFDGGRLDFGAFFPIVFGDNDQVVASFDLPLRMSFGVADHVFLGIDTGLRKLDLVDGENDLFMPLGANLLYNLQAGEHMIDLTARFNWQSFVWVNAPEDWPDRVLQDTFTLSFGANFHFDIGVSTKKKSSKREPESRQVEPVKEEPTVQGKPQCIYNEDCANGGVCQNAQCITPGGAQ